MEDGLNFRQFFEFAPACLLVVNAKLTIVAVSEAYLEATNTERRCLLGRYIFEAFPDNPEDKNANGVKNLHSSLQTVLQTGTSHTMAIQKYDVRKRSTEGGIFEEKFWSPKNSPIKNSKGEVEFIIHRVEDVTHFVKNAIQQNTIVEEYKERTVQTQAECYQRSLELQHTSNLFHSIINATSDIIAAIDMDLTFTVVNKSIQEEYLLRFGKRVSIGMKLKEALSLHPQELRQHLSLWQRVLSGDQITVTERYRDGVCFEISFNPIWDQQDMIIGACLIGRNVTERIQLTASLKKAETANTQQTEFFTNISHEFRTPLTLMLGPLENALNDGKPLPSELQQQMYRNATRLLRMVNSLLDLARLEANRLRVHLEPTNLSRFTSDLASTFRAAIERAGLNFFVDTTSLNEPVYVDREIWEKIVYNLLSNALKYTAKGSITVSLTRNHNNAELRIHDTGIGIPESELPKIFDRFHRVENTEATRFIQGTGIGLALVQELVKLMGGFVKVESVVGQGSTFLVSLPIRSPSEGSTAEGETQKPWLFMEEASEITPGDSSPSTMNDNNNSKEFILIVDDNNDMRQYVKSLLQPMWQVETAENGEQALELIRTRKPNLVLTDLMMPKVDGFQLITAMQRDPSLKSIPVVILSARTCNDVRVQGLHLGADYLAKPFSGKELIARISSHLETSHVRTQLEEQIQQRSEELHRVQEAFQEQTLERLQAEKRFAVEQAQIAKEHKRQLEEFIDTICHEIRNPLSAVFGLITIIQDIHKKIAEAAKNTLLAIHPELAQMFLGMLEELVQSVSIVEQCSQQQKVILDDVLDLSKLENSNVNLEPEPFYPKILLEQIFLRFRGQFEQKKLKWDIVVKEGANGLFSADTKRLSQILMNLILNAVKFTQAGRIFADVSWEPGQDSEGKLTFCVQDTGVGMTTEEVSRLFKRFSQVGEHASSSKGSGLGLYISKKLAEIMGGLCLSCVRTETEGTLHVESTKGKGTRFCFTIRCKKLPNEIQQDYQGYGGSLEEPPMSCHHTILIVEDNFLNQTILKRYLQEKNCECHVANNGLEALTLFETHHFDGIFMDVEMPVLDGLEATKKIREKEHNMGDGSHVPIIGLSGNARAEHREIALRAGMDSYLTKPFHKQELYRIIKEYFDCGSPKDQPTKRQRT